MNNTISFEMTLAVTRREHSPSKEDYYTFFDVITPAGTFDGEAVEYYGDGEWNLEWGEGSEMLERLFSKEQMSSILQKLCKGRKKNKLTYKVTIEPQA